MEIPAPVEPPRNELIHKKIAASEVIKQLIQKRYFMMGSIFLFGLLTFSSMGTSAVFIWARYGCFILGMAITILMLYFNENLMKILEDRYQLPKKSLLKMKLKKEEGF